MRTSLKSKIEGFNDTMKRGKLQLLVDKEKSLIGLLVEYENILTDLEVKYIENEIKYIKEEKSLI